MKSIEFCKFHGFGNDYIVIEETQLLEIPSMGEFARGICDRHTGAGADGVAVLKKLDGSGSDYLCSIINPDGSAADFSGNGTRCAAAYLYFKGLWKPSELLLKTKSGTKKYHLIRDDGYGVYWFEAEIGKPKFAASEIPILPFSEEASILPRPVDLIGQKFELSAVNVGNPVACIFVSEFPRDWRTAGEELEAHPMFPERTNVVFVKVIDEANIEARIWERGAGETSSSGTCCSGAAVIAAITGRTGRSVSVHTFGGITEVVWRADDEILLTGRADLSYCGQWPY